MVYSMGEAAEALGVSYTRVRKAIKRGKVQPWAKIGGIHPVLTEDDLVALRDYLATVRNGRPRKQH